MEQSSCCTASTRHYTDNVQEQTEDILVQRATVHTAHLQLCSDFAAFALYKMFLIITIIIIIIIIIIKRHNNSDNIVYRDSISRIILGAVHESDFWSVYIAT